jgi:hypothetical protein
MFRKLYSRTSTFFSIFSILTITISKQSKQIIKWSFRALQFEKSFKISFIILKHSRKKAPSWFCPSLDFWRILIGFQNTYVLLHTTRPRRRFASVSLRQREFFTNVKRITVYRRDTAAAILQNFFNSWETFQRRRDEFFGTACSPRRRFADVFLRIWADHRVSQRYQSVVLFYLSNVCVLNAKPCIFSTSKGQILLQSDGRGASRRGE